MKKFLKRLMAMLCVMSVCLVSLGVTALASYDPNNPDVQANWEEGFYSEKPCFVQQGRTWCHV